MDLIDLFAKELRTKQLKTSDVVTTVVMLILNSISWISMLDIFNTVVRQEFTGFTFQQFAQFLASYLLYLVSNLVSKRSLTSMFEDLIYNIRLRLLNKIRKMELKSFEDMGSSSFFNIATLDLRYIADIGEVLWYTLYYSILTVGILIYMATISFHVFTAILALLILGILSFFAAQTFVSTRVNLSRNQERCFFELINGLVFGFKELKINQAKNKSFFEKSIKPNIYKVLELRVIVGNFRSEVTVLIMLIWALIILFVTILLPITEFITTDELYSFVTATLLLPFITLMNDINSLSYASISVNRISKFEEELTALAPKEESVQHLEIRQAHKMSLKKLNFQYTDEQGDVTFGIGPIDLEVQAGEITFIIGGNGSGKSTLLKLMVGLYPTLSGQIFIDDVEVNCGAQRELFACIFTDFHLFDRFYGIKDVDDEEVLRMIHLMKLEKKVKYENGGFNTLDLSTGQKKRLALITSLLEDKSIYFFDEWAADQSPEFRDFFYNTLLPDLKARNKMVICVTHDDNYYASADNIYKLYRGELVPYNSTNLGQD